MGGLGFATKGGKKGMTPKTVATKKSGAHVSIPYNAAAPLAYGETDESVDFETFQKKYEQLTVATIMAKKMEQGELFPTPVHVNLSIPYDVAVRLAKWRADYGKGEFDSAAYDETFKTQYEKLSVAQSTAKKLQREM
jgi:hypothetical protein